MKIKITVGIILALSVIILMTMSNPMRRSEDQIRKNLLEVTPVGTSMEEVIEVVNSNENWKLRGTNDMYGYGMRGDMPTDDIGDIEVGVKRVSAYVGQYYSRLIIKTHVGAYWGFDENSKLIDIAVWKEYDVL